MIDHISLELETIYRLAEEWQLKPEWLEGRQSFRFQIRCAGDERWVTVTDEADDVILAERRHDLPSTSTTLDKVRLLESYMASSQNKMTYYLIRDDAIYLQANLPKLHDKEEMANVFLRVYDDFCHSVPSNRVEHASTEHL